MILYETIIKYAEENIGWIYGGVLESEVGNMAERKGSNIGRRCRELVNMGKLERRLIQIDGKGPRVVQYRLAPELVFEAQSSKAQMSLL